MRAAPALLPNCGQQPCHLEGVGHGGRVHLVVDSRRVPPDPVQGVVSEVTFLHRRVQGLVERCPLTPRGLRRGRLAVELSTQCVQRSPQYIRLRQGADGEGIAFDPVECVLPVIGRLLLPGILVEGPRVQSPSQDTRFRIRCAWPNQRGGDGGKRISERAARIARRARPSIVNVFVGQVVPCRSLLQGPQLGCRKPRLLVKRLPVPGCGHQLGTSTVRETDGHERFRLFEPTDRPADHERLSPPSTLAYFPEADVVTQRQVSKSFSQASHQASRSERRHLSSPFGSLVIRGACPLARIR